MIKIAHRGNINGPSDKENEPSQILLAISKGYDVEVDVWQIDGALWLGHDYAEYPLTSSLFALISYNAWFHCKNVEALEYFTRRTSNLKYFWHEEDRYTLTSNGLVWVYPGFPETRNSIVVDLELSSLEAYKDRVYAVCTDYPEKL